MKIKFKVFWVMAFVCLAAGCSTVTKEELGLNKRAPNEFMASPRSPLSVPPEYNLRPVSMPQVENAYDGGESYSAAEKDLLKQVEAR